MGRPKIIGLCSHCQRPGGIMGNGRCRTCYAYYHKYGKERSQELIDQQKERENWTATCKVCKSSAIRSRSRCNACLHYFRTHGKDKSFEWLYQHHVLCLCGERAVHWVIIRTANRKGPGEAIDRLKVCDACHEIEKEMRDFEPVDDTRYSMPVWVQPGRYSVRIR